jgi:hypothetical protein
VSVRLSPGARAGVVEPKKAVSSRESHADQELSRVKKIITAFFRPKNSRVLAWSRK